MIIEAIPIYPSTNSFFNTKANSIMKNSLDYISGPLGYQAMSDQITVNNPGELGGRFFSKKRTSKKRTSKKTYKKISKKRTSKRISKKTSKKRTSKKRTSKKTSKKLMVDCPCGSSFGKCPCASFGKCPCASFGKRSFGKCPCASFGKCPCGKKSFGKCPDQYSFGKRSFGKCPCNFSFGKKSFRKRSFGNVFMKNGAIDSLHCAFKDNFGNTRRF